MTDTASAAPVPQNGLARRGLMLVLSSPSGAGKTSLARRLLQQDERLSFSVSATTRPQRPGEVDGQHYHFTDDAGFDRLLADRALLEHARVFSNRYGTPRAPVEAALQAGRDVLFDIDWQGTQQLMEAARADLVSIFILPPSAEELERRLHGRGQDSAEVIRRRMAEAASEMSHWPEYDYVIVNSDFEDSARQIAAILQAERLKRTRQMGLAAFVSAMKEKL